MKTTNKLFASLLLIGCFTSVAIAQNLIQNPGFELSTPAYNTTIVPASWPSLKGLWEFNNTAAPLTATVGPNLTLNGSHTTIPGFSGSDNATRIGVGSNYRVTHGIPANGGGSYVNRYTILVDFRIASNGTWRTFYQTNQSNSNDAELFIRNSDGMVGVGAVGYGAEGVIPNKWHRLVVSVSLGSFFRVYMDGRLICNGTSQAVDGRFSLDPSIYFMSDDNGDDGLIDVSTIALFDQALTQTEVESLGKWSCDNWLGQGNFTEQFRNGGYATAASGTYYLFAGSDVSTEAYQDVDVSAYATPIDAGIALMTFSGKIQTYLQSPQDQGRILLEYRNTFGTVIGSYDTGNQSTSSVWNTYSTAQTLPASTRTIRVRLLHTKNNGTSNDAYYDDMSLIITSPLGVEAIDLRPVETSLSGNDVIWKYTGEEKPLFFEVERSTSGLEWETVAVVEYKESDQAYNYFDFPNNTESMLYYRIRAVFEDNNELFSEIQAAGIHESTTNWQLIVENPVNTNQPFSIHTNVPDARIMIFNLAGQLIPQDKTGEFVIETPGMYLVTVMNNTIRISEKLIVR